MRNSRATLFLLLQDEQNPGKFQGGPHYREFLHRVDKKAKPGRCGNLNLFSQCLGATGRRLRGTRLYLVTLTTGDPEENKNKNKEKGKAIGKL